MLPTLNQTELERLYKIGVETDPGRPTAGDPNIQPFLKHGKLLTYVGLADALIPAGSTLHYREKVYKALGYPDNLDDSFRTFTSAPSLFLSFLKVFLTLRLTPLSLLLPPVSSRNESLWWWDGTEQLWRSRTATRRPRWRRTGCRL